MRFEILGPLAVADGERPIAVPGAKPRTLLVMLVLHAGQVVPADRLVDGLWGEHLPADPANALQALVSRLRRALDPSGELGLLRSHPPGYLLAADPEQVDAVRFERLAAEGHAALATGRPDAAAALLAEGLALWRGPALADVADEPFAGGEVVRLTELRLAAVEDRVEADLALGRHAAVVGEELGLDPSLELQRLEAAMLAQDAGLDPPAETPARRRTNVRVPLTSFVGRDEEVARVAAVPDQARLVTLTGPGGSGKTRLAVEVAAGLADRVPDGVWLVELAPLRAEGSVADAVAATLGVRGGFRLGPAPLPPHEDPVDRLVELLEAKRPLLVLDNCEHLVGAVAKLTEVLLTSCPGVRILATSREALGVGGERRWPVPALATPPPGLDDPRRLLEFGASRLFVERAKAAAPGFELAGGGAEAAGEICRRLDGLPLAIELAAARVPALTVQAIGARLDDRFRLLTGGSRTALPRQQTLRAVVDWSWELLSEPERATLRRLAVFTGGCTLALRLAAPLSWFWYMRGDRRDAAEWLPAALAAGPTVSSTAKSRVLLTSALFRIEGGDAKGTVAARELAVESRAVAERAGDELGVAWADMALGQLTFALGDQALGMEVLDRALTAVKAAGDRWSQAAALMGRAEMSRYRGDLAGCRRDAEAGLAGFRALGERFGMCYALDTLAFTAETEGHYQRAVALVEEAIGLADELRLPEFVATLHARLGILLSFQGQHRRALAVLGQALAEVEQLGWRAGVAWVRSIVGLAARRRGDLDEARVQLERALVWCREVDASAVAAPALAWLGFVLELQGDLAADGSVHREGLDHADRTGDPRAVALARGARRGGLRHRRRRAGRAAARRRRGDARIGRGAAAAR